jgi:hypothetical protein
VFVFYQRLSTTVDLLQNFNQNDSLGFNNTYSSRQGKKVFRNLSSIIVISIDQGLRSDVVHVDLEKHKMPRHFADYLYK